MSLFSIGVLFIHKSGRNLVENHWEATYEASDCESTVNSSAEVN